MSEPLEQSCYYDPLEQTDYYDFSNDEIIASKEAELSENSSIYGLELVEKEEVNLLVQSNVQTLSGEVVKKQATSPFVNEDIYLSSLSQNNGAESVDQDQTVIRMLKSSDLQGKVNDDKVKSEQCVLSGTEETVKENYQTAKVHILLLYFLNFIFIMTIFLLNLIRTFHSAMDCPLNSC